MRAKIKVINLVVLGIAVSCLVSIVEASGGSSVTEESDWSTVLLSNPWDMSDSSDISSGVENSKDIQFTEGVMSYVMTYPHSWFYLNLGNKTIETARCFKLVYRVYFSESGTFQLHFWTPSGQFSYSIHTEIKGGVWQEGEIDLSQPIWRLKDESGNYIPWGGSEGIVQSFRIDTYSKEGGLIKFDWMKLIGTGTVDVNPPVIIFKEASYQENSLYLSYNITDGNGINPSAIKMIVNERQYDISQPQLKWQEPELIFKPTWWGYPILAIRIEARDKEGNKANFEHSLKMEDLNKKITAVERQSADLYISSGEKRHQEVIVTDSHQYQIEVGGNCDPINEFIRIEGSVVNPKLLTDKTADFTTPDTMVKYFIKPSMTEKEKAFAVYRFMMENFYGMGMNNNIDKAKFANCFGYGFCAAHVSMQWALFNAAGLRWATVNYPGHACTQVYYDNGWHLMDSYMRRYYLERDGKTIASAESIEKDTFLVARTKNEIKLFSDWCPTPQVGEGSREHNQIQASNMRITLRKNERFIRRWANFGKWCHAVSEPLDYGNGEIIYIPDLTTLDYRNGIDFEENIKSYGNDRQRPYIHVNNSGVPAYLTYKVESPYIITEARIKGKFYRKTDKDSNKIYISVDQGKSWLNVWTNPDLGISEHCVDISQHMSQKAVAPEGPFKDVYSYLVKFEFLSNNSPLDAGIDEIILNTDVQLHPKTLPALSRGMNTVTYTSDSHDGPIKITYGWKESEDISISNENPVEGEEVRIKATVRNSGKIDVQNIVVRFFDGNPDLGGMQIAEDQIIEKLSPGEIRTAEIRWVAEARPDRPFGAPPGKKVGYVASDIYVRVDPENKIPETIEFNNEAVLRVVVKEKPDLVISHDFIVTDPSQPMSGDSINIIASISNNPAQANRDNKFIYLQCASAKDVVVQFFDGHPNKGGKRIGEQKLKEIRAAEYDVAEIVWDTRGLSGTHDIYVVVDPENLISEANELNNQSYIPLLIGGER